MKTQISEISPQVYARVVGILYLFTISAGIIAQMGISNGIVVVDDAATTASNLSIAQKRRRIESIPIKNSAYI